MQNTENSTRIIIEGPARLRGRVSVGGSKNAALPILASTLITDEKCVINNVPDLADISVMIKMLRIFGKDVRRENGTVTVTGSISNGGEAPYEQVKKLRASVLVMGALSGRLNKIRVPLPGGCAIGIRPIDLHLKGFTAMGAKYSMSGGIVHLSSKRLKGADIYLDYPSVGATENLLAAAVRAEGLTVIENIAREPEIEDMVNFLKEMGADIEHSPSSLRVRGVNKFRPVEYTVMDDRIQAGTYLMAGALKNADIKIDFSAPETLEAVTGKLRECGADIETGENFIHIKGISRLKGGEIMTAPYPGFPTDLQAPAVALLSLAKGTSVVTEAVFENRFLHCAELMRMGADIEVRGDSAILNGVSFLSGAPVMAMDLRGGAALVIAGLAAKGRTEISGVHHIERGYADLVPVLKRLGADIWVE
ncbi:MAG: UDP-N-acetylglucosamine 1-carboxyvinyltransferase [Elusimicrobia bacterium]|nr:UDP-N-acetylglucosamine 1-carboxyvinyltransferase [Elusimicrobiota bacterium]